jgi:hypothetical protein
MRRAFYNSLPEDISSHGQKARDVYPLYFADDDSSSFGQPLRSCLVSHRLQRAINTKKLRCWSCIGPRLQSVPAVDGVDGVEWMWGQQREIRVSA